LKIILFILSSVMILCRAVQMQAQQPAFYHLSTAEGLSDNNVSAAARDRNGILWIGTSEGLNSFDGNRITTYHKYSHPLMASNAIENIVIDPENRIWLRNATSMLNMMDEKRNFHLFNVGDTADKVRVSSIFWLKSHGLVALKGKQHYKRLNQSKEVFEKIKLPGDSVLPSSISLVNKFNEDTLFFWGDNRLVLYDYKNMKPLFSLPIKGVEGLATLNADELIAYTQKADVFYSISISQKKIIREYSNFTDQFGQAISGSLRFSTRIMDNVIAFTSRFGGVYLVDFSQKTVTNWKHDPLDTRTLGGNNTNRISYDTSGYLLVTSITSGLHYFNTRINQVASKPYFINDEKDVFDGFIESVTTASDGTVWLGCQDRLVRWDRGNDKSTYVPCYLPDGSNISKTETIRAVCFDDKENLWVGTTTKGILVLNKSYKTTNQFADSIFSAKNNIPSNWINFLLNDGKGKMWVGTARGTCIVDMNTFTVINLSKHPVLSSISNIPCNHIWKDKNNRIWIATTRGAWCYDENKNTLVSYNKENGLINNTIQAINEDDAGNFYFGTIEGLSILSKGGSVKNYNRSNGLRNDRCEGILKDEKGFIWIGNLSCILRHDPTNKTFAVYEEGLGFGHAGFRMRCCYKSKNGEMFWGTDRGLTYFSPGAMNGNSFPLRPSISSLQIGDSVFRFTGKENLSFPYNTSSFVFNFSSGELSGKKNQLLYRLVGYDNEWRTPAATGQVAYSKLQPGDYQFEIKASRDGTNWFEGDYPVIITVNKPWWQTAWFRLFVAVLIGGIGWLVIRYYQKRREAKEAQKMIDYFANSGYEYSAVDDILWDICRNCISRLHFEDCVIYLLDDEREVLQQKAAYGPKNPKEFEILNPMEISLSKGIVGNVATTGKASLIHDTSKDSRYIVDDERRFSEITVPIVHEGKVIGVIDSEHRDKNFFTAQHLNALQSIAAICSTKISRAIAVDAMKRNEKELMELNVKMAESKFLNLRLQMNPHFLFNSLSSIQHLIVSKQTTKAYKYLTIFSNFLRSLLKYAEKNFIPLDEEIKILTMYVELESLRFDESFHYEITVDDNLSNEVVFVPSLMVQPFAENAIWHGLLHQEGEKKLTIRFAGDEDEVLLCLIEDNGIGREKAAAIKSNNISSRVHESKGIDIIKERLHLLQQKTGKPASINFDDVHPSGTRVTINIPYYNPEEV